MKVYNAALAALISLSLLFSTTTAADETMGEQEGPTFKTPLGSLKDESVNHRYIVKFKARSHIYKRRMEEAHRRHSMRKNLRRASVAEVTEDEIFLTHGSFLPKDHAEVIYLNDDEVKEWEEKDDVECVELGGPFIYL